MSYTAPKFRYPEIQFIDFLTVGMFLFLMLRADLVQLPGAAFQDHADAVRSLNVQGSSAAHTFWA